MATVVIIDPDTGEEDRKLPEYLASSAKLAAQAFANKQESFECPRTGKTIPVAKIRYNNKKAEVYTEEPGVEITYRGTLWQCWSGGISSKGNEYFRVRARDPLFYTVGRNGFSQKPNVKAYGTIFVNDVDGGKKEYNISLRSIAQTAKNELAERILEADMLSATELMGVDDDVDFGGSQGTKATARSSNVGLGR